MVLDTASCLNCKACVVACKAENGVPLGYSRIWVRETTTGSFPHPVTKMEPGACMHCTQPPCVEVCPADATFVDDWAMIQMRTENCIGCGACIEECPYDARYLNEETEKVDKCSFCRPRVETGLDPACVTTCPTKVRVFGRLSDPESEVSKLLATRKTEVLKEDEGTGPNLYYLVD